LRDTYDEIRSTGADVVAIGTGDARYAASFVDPERIPFLVLVDDDASAARAASVRDSSLLRLVSPMTWPAGMRAFRSGVRQPRSGKRPTQLGATFVIAPGDDVRYSHLDDDASDHAPLDDVMAVLRQ
jgi:peroxiredoxin